MCLHLVISPLKRWLRTAPIFFERLGQPVALGGPGVAAVSLWCGSGDQGLTVAIVAESGDNEKMAALEAKACHQIEYYFGDFNLPGDKCLKEQIKLDEGWVSLEIIIKFNRVSCLTPDFNVIVAALSKSKAELVEISEDKTKIRRSPSKPLPELTDEHKNDVKPDLFIVKASPRCSP
uniref:HTH La-type RNA-binding domain-containing protein n=1 Tax=Prolemur simus TaxID=1328070 RepID=A0A8C9DLS6_PROSS